MKVVILTTDGSYTFRELEFLPLAGDYLDADEEKPGMKYKTISVLGFTTPPVALVKRIFPSPVAARSLDIQKPK